ncbi:MAG: bifunctional glutamate N-acetyltransferase/amino-acid acetyltransferase ArgJ [Actinomycetales bacterium]|nr:bifunctional glutamate N-acetyltransferase/amino-acid acetyltransferase ArgJ [Actinomycetales bacterium]
MSVTFPKGFQAAGVVAGLKASGKPDVALVVNSGPDFISAGVFTKNRIKAAPVLWTQQCMQSSNAKAVLLNSGGANACTGPSGFADTHESAEHVARLLNIGAIEVAVCSTGLIGKRLPMEKIFVGVDAAVNSLTTTGGQSAAEAIMTTDSVAKTAAYESSSGWKIGAMAKGAGMLAPGLATMLVVITTDAKISSQEASDLLQAATNLTFDRIDSDGCMSTNDTVLLLASGAAEVAPSLSEFQTALTEVCHDLARQLIADAEGATKDIQITVSNAATESDALEVARAISRSNLLKCAIHGQDPNWGRVLAALGTTNADFEPDQIDVDFNQVAVCRSGSALAQEPVVDLSGRVVEISVSLNAGVSSASLWTNDLTAMYVHENSAYST